MSDGVTTFRDGHILEVTLDRGKVNAIDVPTCLLYTSPSPRDNR